MAESESKGMLDVFTDGLREENYRGAVYSQLTPEGIFALYLAVADMTAISCL